ncbi:Calcineurin-like protein phosphoesterase [Dinothrombium tinctorium]|uniref:Serine/threonine-protein phosphatase n=1 Tax=Dinothrombium tinctorium TaxID=1965070 RepID=A0A3S3P5V7_9ACAR|nr:Calcineurin-like protein phosphoesterase [Dinothrombium tinctorium]
MSRKTGKEKFGGIPSRSPSLESTASQLTAPVQKIARKASKNAITHDGVFSLGQYLYECCAVLLYCPKHKNFGLSKISTRKGMWMPQTAVKESEGWFATIVSRIKSLLTVSTASKSCLPFTPPELLHIFRIQVPSAARFVNRVTYFIQITHDEKSAVNCCQSNKLVTWISAKEVVSYNIQDLWGPEVPIFAEAIMTNSIDKAAFTEYTLRDAMKYAPRDPPKTYQDELLKSAKFSEKDVSKIYAEFIQHVYPSQYMVLNSFTDYMKRLGWSSNDPELTSCFRAFAFNSLPYISFHEFLLGLAALDKNTYHGGHPGELRCGYIFRFYDANSDNMLERKEMFKLTYDMLKLKGKQCDEEAVKKELEKNYAGLGVAQNESIDYKLFIKGIGLLIFRGSSALFRCSFSIIEAIGLKRCYDSLSALHPFTEFGLDFSKKLKGSCARCRAKKYSLAMFAVRINPEGFPVESVEISQTEVQNLSEEKKLYETIQFNPEHICNQMMDLIRDQAVASCGVKPRFSQKNKTHEQLIIWTTAEREHLASQIMKVAEEAETIFRKESRVVKMNSPAYILGDIHGNLHDLILYERTLWDKGPACVAASYLFLGDYVDRGDFSLECAVYLMSAKVLNPEKFLMLRGNHELRQIQMVFTFFRECLEKFGKNLGQTVWEACNKAFDSLPICAVIDETIFCAHGGIPMTASKLEELYSIPVPLSNPEKESPPAWEVLWNDPISANDFGEYAEMLRLQSGSKPFANLQGFLPNTKRGTAYYFSEEAVNKFLTSNGLTHVIRAHEMIPPGYQFHIGGKVITVFSSSRYCGGNNEAACIFTEQEKIRVLILDTNDQILILESFNDRQLLQITCVKSLATLTRSIIKSPSNILFVRLLNTQNDEEIFSEAERLQFAQVSNQLDEFLAMKMKKGGGKKSGGGNRASSGGGKGGCGCCGGGGSSKGCGGCG